MYFVTLVSARPTRRIGIAWALTPNQLGHERMHPLLGMRVVTMRSQHATRVCWKQIAEIARIDHDSDFP